tara:strand:- start:28 stop:273 length:246 start_codon:yes stop_codon:yes gene_type:complete
MSIFLKCEDANIICDKNQYKEASFWDSVKLNFHLVYCKLCRQYTMRNKRLTKLFKKSDIKTMPLEAKVAIKQRLQQEMTKQ